MEAVPAVPEEAAWAVLDHGTHRVAYDVVWIPFLPLRWDVRDGAPAMRTLTFLRADGTVLERREVGV
jgi:hypothetical protein